MLRILIALAFGMAAGMALGLWLHDLRPVRGMILGKLYGRF